MPNESAVSEQAFCYWTCNRVLYAKEAEDLIHLNKWLTMSILDGLCDFLFTIISSFVTVTHHGHD